MKWTIANSHKIKDKKQEEQIQTLVDFKKTRTSEEKELKKKEKKLKRKKKFHNEDKTIDEKEENYENFNTKVNISTKNLFEPLSEPRTNMQEKSDIPAKKEKWLEILKLP